MGGLNPVDVAKDRKDILVPLLLVAVLITGMAYFFNSGGDYWGGSSGILTRRGKTEDRNDKYSAYPEMILEDGIDYKARIETSMGNVTVDLYETDTPLTVNSFVFLAKEGFYDGMVFHRVIKDFIIQAGDPLGDGTGGPGYEFKDEFVSKYKFEAGALAMANSGPNTNGSQFFIVVSGGQASHLDGKHTIFGKVIDGMNIVDQIADVEVKGVEPVKDVVIEKVVILEEAR